MENERNLPPRNIEVERAEIKEAMKSVRRRRRGPLLLGIMNETFAGYQLFNFLRSGLEAAREVNTPHGEPIVFVVAAALSLGFFGYFEFLALKMWKKIQGSNEQLHILREDLRSLRRLPPQN